MHFQVVLVCIVVNLATTIALQMGERCDPNPYYSASWQYEDSCDNVYLYCDANTSTCQLKGCSNADFILGWDTQTHNLPSRCNSTTFCPDSNSQCTPLLPVGGHCEMQRDDECAGQNSICLNSTCHIKGVPLGAHCGADTTNFVTYDAQGYAIHQTIIRDNCTTGAYCDEQRTSTCITAKPNGQFCNQDRECLSETCHADGICINGPEVFRMIPSWLWGVVGLSIVLFVLLTMGALWILQRYQSRKEHEKIAKFFGDNEEFAKHALMDHDSQSTEGLTRSSPPTEGHGSFVYLATPDYVKSSALSAHSWRNPAPKHRDSSFSHRDTTTLSTRPQSPQ
ncbi:uncharacterized protein BYT42DRAFT_556380 [Radiomyces spectabilis]|uniref:uncharacterized protein n=1 Tax=Radiomyces spectabilis TaxID=64574 RepID=UPI0022209A18|nr:uncharacterized protein BYT42DRAFT_556380 [Radiomyces spectabilis]KAI8391297.1 hypothetical protein BYT42DRAFT_556380 [Radiomyces spectabilis]